MYSGITYGLKEARGAHDWVKSFICTFIIFLTECLILECKHCCLKSHSIHTYIHFHKFELPHPKNSNAQLNKLCFHSRKIVLLLGQSLEQHWLSHWKILHMSRLFNVPSRELHCLLQPIFSLENSRLVMGEIYPGPKYLS